MAGVAILDERISLAVVARPVAVLGEIAFIRGGSTHRSSSQEPAPLAADPRSALRPVLELAGGRFTAQVISTLLWCATVTLFSSVHQLVAAEGRAVFLLRPGDVQQTRAPLVHDHGFKVIRAAAAEVHGACGSSIHDAGICVTFTVAPIVVSHPQVVTQLMSHDGCKVLNVGGKHIDSSTVAP